MVLHGCGAVVLQGIGVPEREFFIDNRMIRIHFNIEMILVDRPRAMAV